MKQNNALRALIREIPKNDIHVHLDGSLRLDTLIEIAGREGIALPGKTPEELTRTLFKDNYDNLEDYLESFNISCKVMQNPENIERIAYELAIDNQAEGVCYLEVRFAPQLHMNAQMSLRGVFTAVNSGLLRAQKEYNRTAAVKDGTKPPFYYGIIGSALRRFDSWSPYYKEFLAVHQHSKSDQIVGMASLELAKAIVKIRDKTGLPIVGLDLSGPEAGNRPRHHRRAFQYVHEAFMHKTVHAGEAYGPESIFEAISELHADRIGDGFFLFDPSKIRDPRITDREKYIHDLVQYIANKRITIEVNLTSSVMTEPTLTDVKAHSFGKMLEHKISTAFCTNSRTACQTTITDEILTAWEHFPLDRKLLRDSIIYGFKRSFFPGSYMEKRAFVRQCITTYEKLTESNPLLDR
ncbi:adenosine deaminase family protein [Desulfobacterales bacterium HSG17]|nr:adenosine deaminase family protein [Desulfobacterales bacterium HSG17]